VNRPSSSAAVICTRSIPRRLTTWPATTNCTPSGAMSSNFEVKAAMVAAVAAGLLTLAPVAMADGNCEPIAGGGTQGCPPVPNPTPLSVTLSMPGQDDAVAVTVTLSRGLQQDRNSPPGSPPEVQVRTWDTDPTTPARYATYEPCAAAPPERAVSPVPVALAERPCPQRGTTVTTQRRPGARLRRPSQVRSAQSRCSARAT
jgi:hypothetical protein